MKITEYIEVKRQYTPPRIHVKVLLMEGKLLAGTNATGGNMGGEGGNIIMSKGASYLEDDEIEE